MAEDSLSGGTIDSLRDENRRLRRAVEELSVLNDLARVIGASYNSQEIMQTIIRRSLKAVGAEQGVITLVDRNDPQPAVTLVRTMVSSSQHEQFHLNQSLLGWMYLNKKPLIVNNPGADERFQGIKWDEDISSLLCVPLMVKSALTGVLTVYNKKDGQEFSDDDQRLLAIIGGQSAQIVENARLFEEEKQLLKIQEEITLASKIQTDLLPKSSPQIPGYEIVGRNTPAQVVGGDYFDFVQIDEDRWAICLGDVSGKGLPASLLMASTQATLRSQFLLKSTPKESLERSNVLLYRTTSPEKFVTLFLGILDVEHHRFTYCNAGHDNPFWLRGQKSMQRLGTGGLVLGIAESFPYEEEMIPMDHGDTIVIYSDGITESINAQEEFYGEERLTSVLERHGRDSAQNLMQRIIDAAKGHAGSHPQSDDMTVVVVKRLGI